MMRKTMSIQEEQETPNEILKQLDVCNREAQRIEWQTQKMMNDVLTDSFEYMFCIGFRHLDFEWPCFESDEKMKLKQKKKNEIFELLKVCKRETQQMIRQIQNVMYNKRPDSFEYRFSIGYDHLHFERLFFKLDVAEEKRELKEGCQQDYLSSALMEFKRKLTEVKLITRVLQRLLKEIESESVANWEKVYLPTMFQGGQSRRKQFFRKGRNKREQWKSEKVRKSVEIWGRNAITQHAAPQQRGKLINITKDHAGFDDAEKGGGKQSVCADCHLRSPHTSNDDHFVVHAECRPKCPFVVNDKKRNAGQTNDVATQTFPVREPGEAISRRNGITQHAAPQQRGKLNDIAEDQCEFDDTEKGGGKQSVCADCHLKSPHTSNDDHFVVHAECRPKCPFVVNDKKRNAGQTNDVATQTFPLREPGEAISRRNGITQHAAPQQRGKLNDIAEDQCEFDDTEKEIQELEQLLRCKVCLDSDACIVFFPCRHMVTCEYCEGFLQRCPVCRSFIEEAEKINEE